MIPCFIYGIWLVLSSQQIDCRFILPIEIQSWLTGFDNELWLRLILVRALPFELLPIPGTILPQVKDTLRNFKPLIQLLFAIETPLNGSTMLIFLSCSHICFIYIILVYIFILFLVV